mmetsp:Transcript_758/g.1801  ORF Transcript_758/g.1801 Transcript_758/m.1801 type:complete len:87 (+) Transcript_758:27-287(+)
MIRSCKCVYCMCDPNRIFCSNNRTAVCCRNRNNENQIKLLINSIRLTRELFEQERRERERTIDATFLKKIQVVLSYSYESNDSNTK